MRKILFAKFFNRPTLKVAKELLGKFLVRRTGSKKISGMITEVEAYVGSEDKASHASRGQTERNKIMFGKAGHWYIYFTYGTHWMLNIVTEREGYPAAILIRGVKDVNGPGRLTKFFKIDKSFNGKPANYKTGLWIEDRGVKINPHTNRAQKKKSCALRSARYGVGVNPRQIKRGKRIGVDYAGEWKEKLWRFYLPR